MLAFAEEAIGLAVGYQRHDLHNNRQLELALTRLVELVGEAATRVSAAGRGRCAEIPWRAMVAMRNRLIHGYDSIDADLLWDTVEVDLPALVRQLKAVLKVGI